MHPKLGTSMAFVKPYVCGIGNSWVAIRPHEKLNGIKRKLTNIINRVWKAEQSNVNSVIEQQIVNETPTRSFFQLQRFQSTIIGAPHNGFVNNSFFTGAFAKTFLSKRMRVGHLIAFSTLLLSKEESFEAFEALDKRISAYEKICANIKSTIKKDRTEITSEPPQILHSIKQLSMKDLIAVGSNGIVFSAEKPPQTQEACTEDNKQKPKDTSQKDNSDLAVKMVFNFSSSSYFVIKRMVESELLICDYVPCVNEVDKWQIKKHSRMKLPDHSNILKIKQAIIDKVPVNLPQSVKYSAAMPSICCPTGHGRSTAMFLVMKKYSLTLKDLLSDDMVNEQARPLLCLQLLQAVGHLEKHCVVHRDLKSENILIEYDAAGLPRLVIGDFGCALVADCVENLILPFAMDVRDGTPSIQPPEVANAVVGKGNIIDYRKCDAWAAGGLLCEILGHGNPLQDKVDADCLKNLPIVWKWIVTQLSSRNTDTRLSATLASNILYMELFGPLLPKGINVDIVRSWLLMHAAEYHIYKKLPWGRNSVVCDIFYNFLTSINSESLEHCLQAWCDITSDQ